MQRAAVRNLYSAGILCVSVMCGFLPHMLFAHATPITYTPEGGSTELTVPEEISIYFTERIEPGASSIKVFAPDGAEVNVGKGAPNATDARIFSVPITNAGEGVYAVSWQVVSVDDGHFTKGAHSFLVDSTGKAFEGDSGGGVDIVYVTKLPEAVFNFLMLLGESIYIGALFVLLLILKPYVLRSRFASTEERERVSFEYTHLMIVGCFLLLLGMLAMIVKKTTELAELQESSFGETLWVFLASSSGTGLVFKVAIALVFLGIFLGLRKKIFSTYSWTIAEGFLVVLLGFLLYFQSSVSHAAATFFHPKLAVLVTIVHLFGKELVIGALLTLFVLLVTIMYGPLVKRLGVMLAAYDTLAGFAVLLAGTTGVYVTWLHLKSFEHLFTTEWGTRFLILLLLTFMLGSWRLLHQFVLHPYVMKSMKAKQILEMTMPVEIGIGLLVLFISGFISITTPPFTVEQYRYEEQVTSNGLVFTLDAHPYERDSMRLVVHDEKTNALVSGKELILTVTNSARGIGPNVIAPESRFLGGYAFSKNAFSPAGEWALSVILKREGAYDTHANFKMMYPDALTATKYSDEFHGYDSFARAFFIAFGVVTLVSLVLIAHALYRLSRELKRDVHEVVPLQDSRIPKRFITGILFVCVLCSLYCTYTFFIQTDFEKRCLQDGFEWRQTFPVRDFEVVSPNAESGCYTHGGHYHFIDEREYDAFMKSM